MRPGQVFLLVAGLISVFTLVTPAASQKTGPEESEPLRFIQLGSWPSHKIEVAPETKTTLKGEDGEVYSGAIFRMTPVRPVTIVPGLEAKEFINLLVAQCDKMSVVLVQSVIVDEEGKEHPQSVMPQLYPVEKNPAAPSSVAFRFLCQGEGKTTPFGSARWV